SGGLAGTTRLLEATSLADVHAPHMTFASGPSPDSRVSQQAYGMGWGVEVYRGHRRIQHGGGIDGFITAVSLYPDDDLGIVAFTNIGSGLPALLSSTVADRVLGLEPVDWLGEALARMAAGEAELAAAEEKAEDAKVDGTSPSRALDDYVGDYSHPGYGTVEVKLVDGALAFTFNGIEAPLEHWHYDVFKGGRGDDPVFEDSRLHFRGNFEGQIAEVLIPFELSASPIVFERKPGGELTDPEYLSRVVGRYQSSGQVVSVTLSGETLTLHVPGQPAYALRPEVSGRFSLEGLQGFSVGFEEVDGAVTKAIFYQPNGVFESIRVEE
ncbi:MAG: DUF3471 domain-containing protein, partial [Acidobacteriota bacterium]